MLGIEFYETPKENSEVRDFLTDLNQRAKAGEKEANDVLDSVQYTMTRVREEGPIVGMPHTRHLRNGIWELRPNRYRMLFFMWRGKLLLLSVFRKSTQQTPPHEIDRAEARMSDWLRRKGK